MAAVRRLSGFEPARRELKDRSTEPQKVRDTSSAQVRGQG
jgi:hypothetical protein